MRRILVRSPFAALTIAIVFLAASVATAAGAIGIEKFDVAATNQNGTLDLQAGSHPYALTTTFEFKRPAELGKVLEGDVKDLTFQLPPGLVGNAAATPRCTDSEFTEIEKPGSGTCPIDTAVGVETTYLTEVASEITPFSTPVYNLVPPKGVAAEFGFVAAKRTPVLILASLRTGADYGVTTSVPNIPQAAAIVASKVTLWGVPGEAAHDQWRGSCEFEAFGVPVPSLDEPGFGLGESEIDPEGPDYPTDEAHRGLVESTGGSCGYEHAALPLLTNPTSCHAPRQASMTVDSWEEPGEFHEATASMPALSGCEKLDFKPTIAAKPTNGAAASPSGLNVDLALPQTGTESASGLAEAAVKDTSVTLPAGMGLNASAADGLGACTTSQAGFTGFTELNKTTAPGVRTAQFTSTAAECPDSSKLANVKIKTPDLEGELEGAMYLASPQNFAGLPENPFSSLVAMYLIAEEPKAGVLVKLAGDVALDPVTGQVTTSFQSTPQLPFNDLSLEFPAGERAALSTPATCGTYTTEATLTPWSGTSPVSSSSTFQVTSGPGGSPCPGAGPLPFSPSLQTGTDGTVAGAFAPLSTIIRRSDGQQAIHNVTITYPPGVSAVLTGVPECGEAQANAGTCPEATQIGEDTASVGVGQDPYTVAGGRVYLTGPYQGAPFGLSIVTPTKAGPFVLDEGAPVVTRAKIDINATTGAVTVTTGELPRILDGIPLQVKAIDVNINRPNFAINPTSCEHMSVSGSIGGWEDASFPVSDRFQVGSCQSLPFHPQFSASTEGHTSKADGASLKVKIASAGLGQANISKVDLTIPAILPTRLTTIQRACTEAQFNANPAGCPAASLIASATVHTPLLPDPLSGPVYFVSHGGAAFPDTEIILQGDGVELLLDGHTQITKGVTYSHFETVPDEPFTSFEFNAPEGPYSIFGVNVPEGDNYNLCQLRSTITTTKKVTKRIKGHNRKVTVKVKKAVAPTLLMPTSITAQNGAVMTQNTKIAITGCPVAKAAKKKAKAAKKRGRKANARKKRR
jgi:hypothetical protein